MLNAIRTEYTRYRRMIELALEQVRDEDLHRRLTGDANGNSIAVLLGHLTGNLKSRFTEFLTSDGEKPWRERDREFEDAQRDRAALLKAWSAAWEVLDHALDDVAAAGDGALDHTVTIRGQPLTVAEALVRSVAHLASHAGQVVLMARAFAGDRWRTLSIPRGGSAAYAADPDKEKTPDGK